MNFITLRPILPEAFLLAKAPASCGGTSIFFGTVRNEHGGRPVKELYYECYASMANRQIRRIKEEIAARFQLGDLRILHRTGLLQIGDIAVAVSASAPHRAEAFSACEETVERIKHEVPIWKKEFYADGTCEWVLSCAQASRLAA